MAAERIQQFTSEVIEKMPLDWLQLTTHRLDVYDEERAKTQFLDELENLSARQNMTPAELAALPTAYDYIRLGHPLSSVLEWATAKLNNLEPQNVICFSSRVMPILAVLRKNLLLQRKTQIVCNGQLPDDFDPETIRRVYGYNFELHDIGSINDIPDFDGSTIFVHAQEDLFDIQLTAEVDFYVSLHSDLGSLILINGDKNASYTPEIQHVRRRESIAMTPADCLTALKQLTGKENADHGRNVSQKRQAVHQSIKDITGASTTPVVGSSGLSIQYAITMGLIDDTLENHAGHPIKLVIPPNCYGGTNDQARRVAACRENVEVVDLPVDGDHNMVQSIDQVLDKIAQQNAVPFIIVEIPTNPRVEVPDLDHLKAVLSKERFNTTGNPAIDPVFILDQTFCPNVRFLGENDILASIRTISYVSGSKFPSGGRCTAGYCLANKRAEGLMDKIDKHLRLCDNQATKLQFEILAEQLPSMLRRIQDAYANTREFVTFIRETLPEAKINFVSHDLAQRGFTPSVFSLDLPTKGTTHDERESYKRALNHKLISMMITNIPDESKYCVSYGQLKGCYWTIPATSTQGTTKEEDKDYIARVACSPKMDLEKHKQVFQKFVEENIQG